MAGRRWLVAFNRVAKAADFKKNKPLIPFVKGSFAKYDLKYNKFKLPKPIGLTHFLGGKKITLKEDLVFGIKAQPEEFTRYAFLNCWEGGVLILRYDILEVLKEFCSSDFQEFKVVLMNLEEKDKLFKNYKYYIINPLFTLDVLDHEKSEWKDFGTWQSLEKPFFKADSMRDHHICIVKDTTRIVVSPYLALKLKKFKSIDFYVDWED